MKKTEQIIALVNDFIRKENNKVQGRVDKAMSEMFEHMEKLANQEKGEACFYVTSTKGDQDENEKVMECIVDRLIEDGFESYEERMSMGGGVYSLLIVNW
jgi:3-dehydroquinate synthetase